MKTALDELMDALRGGGTDAECIARYCDAQHAEIRELQARLGGHMPDRQQGLMEAYVKLARELERVRDREASMKAQLGTLLRSISAQFETLIDS